MVSVSRTFPLLKKDGFSTKLSLKQLKETLIKQPERASKLTRLNSTKRSGFINTKQKRLPAVLHFESWRGVVNSLVSVVIGADAYVISCCCFVAIGQQNWYSPQAAKTTDGRILLAMTTGLGVLDPRNLDQNTISPPVQIDDILADGQQIRRSDNLLLPRRVRNVHFTYAALSFVAPRKVLFRYKLEGFESNWSEPVSRREVTYTNLPARDYKFHVIACNNDGVWNETGAVLSFTIPPAFTQRVSLKLLCVLGTLAFVYLICRLRVRRVTKQLRARMHERLAKRERIARDLHDTFFQDIQGLLLRFHTATSQLDKEQPARTIFEETLRQSDKVMLERRELVFNLRATATTQSDLRLVFGDCGEQMGQSGSCDFKVVVNGAVYPLHPVVFEEIAKIGNEALVNAFRHSGAKSIETELNFEHSELRICIRNDARGIEDDILQRGCRYGHLGLPGMKERAQKIGAHLDLWTRPGAGTEIELRISAGLAYASGSERGISRLRRLWRNNSERS